MSGPTGVLILGGGIMQLPAVRIAKAMGWEVSVAALRIDESIAGLADRCVEVDVSDIRAVEEAARALKRERGLQGVFTAGTDFSVTVAWVAERLGLPGIPYEAALDATDKARMRMRLRGAGIPCPSFVVLREAPGRVLGGLSFPLVVKPVDNMGARGVRRVDTEEELDSALSSAWAQSRSGRAIVEEFLEGPELSLDALIHDGRVTVCGVADRHIVFEPYFVEMGHTMPSELETERLREAEAVFERGIRALGLDHGAAKGDIKMTQRGAVVGEIAARLSGGYMSGWTYPLSSGVEVTEAALCLAVGLPPGDLAPRFRRVSAERAFVSIPGRVRGITGVEEAAALPGVREVFLRVDAGREVELPINNMGKCGNVISVADTREQAVASAEEAARRILVRLVPGNESTDRFLTERLQRGYAAFPKPSARLARALARLPERAGQLPSPERPLRILLPPEVEQERSRDWHGCTLMEAFQTVCRVAGAKPAGAPARDAAHLGRPFWRALLKGGVQAGVYLVDTVRGPGGIGGTAWSYLARS